jgi:hypothetical protein
MICRLQRTMVSFLASLAILAVPAWSQSDLNKLKSDYESVTSTLQKHIVMDWWIDDDPKSPELLAQQWFLASQWVIAWLNEYPATSSEAVKEALIGLTQANAPEYLELGEGTFLVVAPGPIGNVFMVAKSDGRYRLAWSIAQPQEAHGEQAEILAAWRPENARHGHRGPYFAATGSAGSVIPRLGKLPSDAKGRPRFYIDGTYAQSAGGTVGGQTSVWLWDGKTAKPQVVHAYAFVIDQSVGTHVEGDLLKVQQKKFFRTFFSCGICEERQTDWIVRVTPEGVEDLGEKSLVPELDVADELFYRVIHHDSPAAVAASSAVKAAEKIVRKARAGHSAKEWTSFPTLGMMGRWKVREGANGKILCLSLDDAGTNLFTLKSVDGKFLIADLNQTDQDCEK